ncbi:glycosyltransferase family 39 protein [Apilactobacillus xinyiensis]|uniref:glycosyltransferase family 39 protein n=1 Tax=Apilactobacillus xinyiensis TaxID=2841032 RepID=UPI001C7CDBB6|nr:glycosyltransferase family 39 protein [Apilactobacillus xinyiensis]
MLHNQKLNFLYIVVGFIAMLILTSASPIFKVNSAWDANMMFTIGKSLWNGMLPYKDLFDQRGPLIYFMHSIAALISYKSFLGIYIFESIALSIDLIYTHKIVNLFFKNKIAQLVVFLIIPIIFNSYFFENGDLPEEFITPMIIVMIYHSLQYSIDKMPKRIYILQAVFVGIAFWTKYTLVAPWIGFFGYIFIYFLMHKDYKKILQLIINFMTGFAIITVPIIIFYWINKALSDLFYVYFYLNLNYYHKNSFTFINVIKNIIMFPLAGKENDIIAILFIIGIVYVLINYKKINNIALILTTLLTNLIVIMGASNNYRYYMVGLSAYLLFFILTIANFANNLSIHLTKLKVGIYILACLGMCTITNNSLPLAIKQFYGNNIFQIKYAKLINKGQQKTLLNYGNLDVGIYTVAGIVPHNKYFAQINMTAYKKVHNSQLEYLKNKNNEFVELTEPKDAPNDFNIEAIPYLKQHYRLINTTNSSFENSDFINKLYKLKY